MTKALREAKRHSSWLNPNHAWEGAVAQFVRRILDPAISARFLDTFRPLAVRVAQAGMWNSLSQTLIKVTAPGVPDFYQGTEVWDYSLVDPDNRRIVDYEHRRTLLSRVPSVEAESIAALGTSAVGAVRSRGHMIAESDSAAPIEELVKARADGRIKLYVTSTALRARRSDLDLYRHGAYVPLAVTGARAAHVFAFARVQDGRASLTIVPRLTTSLVGDPAAPPVGREVWADTAVVLPATIPEQAWRHLFTGDPIVANGGIRLSEALERFPVALLKAIG
jgi:(1->4)-alpha-D-glucan 1-alpha-D-glucosylmutase